MGSPKAHIARPAPTPADRKSSDAEARWGVRRRQTARRMIRVDAQPKRGPGLWIAVVCLAVTGATLGAWLAGRVSYAVYLPLQAASMFMLIEMGHEAIHGAVHPNRTVNNAVGQVCTGLFGSSFRMHRRQHLSHHAHAMTEADGELTTIPSRSAKGLNFAIQTPLHGLGYVWKLRWSSLRHHPDERAGLVLLLSAMAIAFLLAPKAFVLGWLLPSHVAMFFFWLIAGFFSHALIGMGGDLTVPSLSPAFVQRATYFHEEHHLRPGYPFYQWPSLYRRRVEALRRLAPEQRDFVLRELRLLPIDPPR